MTNQNWHVITKLPMTEEERKEMSEQLGYDVEYEYAFFYGNLPEDGQEVLITMTWGSVVCCCFCNDGYEMGFDGLAVNDVVAWMHLPEPYKGGT